MKYVNGGMNIGNIFLTQFMLGRRYESVVNRDIDGGQRACGFILGII